MDSMSLQYLKTYHQPKKGQNPSWILFTLQAIEQLAKVFPPTIFGQDPPTTDERRLMAHVLSMTAGQVGHPITSLILMKPDNCLVHGSFIRSRPTTD